MIRMIPSLKLEEKAQVYAQQFREHIARQLAGLGYKQVNEVTGRGNVVNLPLDYLRRGQDLVMVDKSVFHPEVKPKEVYVVFQKN